MARKCPQVFCTTKTAFSCCPPRVIRPQTLWPNCKRPLQNVKGWEGKVHGSILQGRAGGPRESHRTHAGMDTDGGPNSDTDTDTDTYHSRSHSWVFLCGYQQTPLKQARFSRDCALLQEGAEASQVERAAPGCADILRAHCGVQQKLLQL